MAAFVSLLRAVNVGGTGKIPMAELRALYEAQGFTDVASYVQSGNVVFRARGAAAAIGRRLEAAVAERFGFETAIVIRTPAELRDVVARNPYPDHAANLMLVLFLADAPAPGAVAAVTALDVAPDRLTPSGREVFLAYDASVARSPLSKIPLEKRLGVAGTARNWNTVRKLLELAEARE